MRHLEYSWWRKIAVAKFCAVAAMTILISVSTVASLPAPRANSSDTEMVSQLSDSLTESVANDSLALNTPPETDRRFLSGEPATIILLGLGLAGVAIVRRRFN
jgi:hypothetical protein